MKTTSNYLSNMLMKKIAPVIALSFIVVVFLFSGCTSSSNTNQTTSATGTDAIAVSFTPGAPPENVPEKEEFEVSVKLENKGGHPLNPGDVFITLVGVNPESVSMTADSFRMQNQETLIESRTIDKTKVPGGIETVDWTGLKYIVPITSDNKLNFVAEACYNYQTTATADVCLSANPFAQTTGKGTCTVQGEKKATNSPAPVIVTKVVENPAGTNKFTFTFTIKNSGKGDVYDMNIANSNCADLQVRDLDKVYIASISIGNRNFEDCAGKEVRLVDGQGQFFCTTDVGTVSGDYTDLLTVKLNYGYRSQAQKTITIKNVFDENEA